MTRRDQFKYRYLRVIYYRPETFLDQGAANRSLVVKSTLPSIFVNKVLVEHQHAHPVMAPFVLQWQG